MITISISIKKTDAKNAAMYFQQRCNFLNRGRAQIDQKTHMLYGVDAP